MIPIKVEDIANIVNGIVICTGELGEVTHICIDSREVQKGSLFIPIKGEKHDGHEYIENAFEKGAIAVLTEIELQEFTDKWVIKIEDGKKSICNLTKYLRKLINIPIIALTGSSGKTTTKDIIYAVLNEKFDVLKTLGNQNNDLGVPLTIFRLEEKHEIAVIEMGMDHKGEISYLVDMVEPNIAIITNIGLTHIENLKSQINIYEAKKEIFQKMKREDLALVNGDDAYLSTFQSDKFTVEKYGIKNEDLNITASNIHSSSQGITFDVEYKGALHKFTFSLPGMHNVYNCLSAIYIGYYYNMTYDEIQQGLNKFIPSNNRMDIKKIKDIVLINDSYNANPDAMQAAAGVLAQYKNSNSRTIAVIGDMLEMGDESSKYHKLVGKHIFNMGSIDKIVAVGNEAKYYIEGAMSAGMPKEDCVYFSRNVSAIDYLLHNLKKNDIYLIKGSRGIKMEEIVFALERS